jgi:hypothetical protein
MKKEDLREEIVLEVTKNYPNWSRIIELSEQARELEYPNDESGLYELSGLKEAFDQEIKPKQVIKDDNFWES